MVVVTTDPQAGIALTYETGGTGDGGDQVSGLDRFGRIVTQNWINTTTLATVDGYTYTYDADGNVLTKDNMLNSSLDETYAYDALNRLVSDTVGGVASQSWNLNAAGDMSSVTTDGVVQGNTTNGLNQLTSAGSNVLTYDANGNTTTDSEGDTLVYDAWNRLIEVKGSSGAVITSYAYDGLGRQISQSPTGENASQLYYSAQGQIIEERTDTSTSTAHVQYVWSMGGMGYVNDLVLRDYGYSFDGAFSVQDRVYAMHDANYNTTGLVTLHDTLNGDADFNGSVDINDLAIMAANWQQHVAGGASSGDFDDSGFVDINDLAILDANWEHTGGTTYWAVGERFTYSAYGVVSVKTASWAAATVDYLGWNYLFQGMRYDAATGLYQTPNRAYDPNTGTWLQQDPMGYVNGMDDYQAMADNPINALDPTGLEKILVIFEGASGFPGGTVQDALQGNGRTKLHSDIPIFNSNSGQGNDMLDAKAGEIGGKFEFIHHGTGAWPGPGNSSGVDAALNDIKHDLGKCPKAAIAVIGHSWGGDAVWEFLGRLHDELHVRANLVATFDPRPRANGDDYSMGFWTKGGIYSWENVKPVNIGSWTGDWTNYYREGLDKNGNTIGNPTVHSMSLGGYALPGPSNVPDARPKPNGGTFGIGNHLGIVGEFIDQFIAKFRKMPETQ